jgi:hypothetical protein
MWVPGSMSSHHEEPPIDVEGVPAEENVNTADAAEDLAQEPVEKKNFTERHPEHFRNPPGNVRDLREEDKAEDA